MPDLFVAPTVNPATKKSALPNDSSLASLDKTPSLPTLPLTKTPVRKGVHLFTSIGKNPPDMYFQNQEEEEKVLLFVRKAFITNFPWIFFSILFLLLPLFVNSLFLFFNFKIFAFPNRYFLFFLLFYYLLVISYIYVSFITWYFKISLVTNVRVIEVDFSNLVYKNVAATKIDLIQDVSYSQVGVLRTIFDYGDVLVQTAGTIDNFTFEAVPQPDNVVQVIGDLIGKEENV